MLSMLYLGLLHVLETPDHDIRPCFNPLRRYDTSWRCDNFRTLTIHCHVLSILTNYFQIKSSVYQINIVLLYITLNEIVWNEFSSSDVTMIC